MENNEIYLNAKKHGVPIIRDESYKILVGRVKHERPMHILEIGTAVGFSAIAMLGASDADIITIEHNKDFVKEARHNLKKSGYKRRAKVVFGDCLVELAKMVANEKYNDYFDFIFLDGPKAQYGYMLDLLVILLKNGGTLAVDNVLFHGYINKTKNEQSKRFKTIIKRLDEFIEKCKNHSNLVNFELNSIEDGMIFAKKGKNEK